jgi:hypothetical protein
VSSIHSVQGYTFYIFSFLADAQKQLRMHREERNF